MKDPIVTKSVLNKALKQEKEEIIKETVSFLVLVPNLRTKLC